MTLETIYSELLALVGEFRAFAGRVDAQFERVDRIDREIGGNGQPGLRDRLSSLETKFADHSTLNDKRLGWVWGVVASAVAAAVSAIGYMAWEIVKAKI